MGDEGAVAVTEPDVTERAGKAGAGGRARASWNALLTVLTVGAEILIVLAVVGEICATVANIYSRHVLNRPLAWTDDLAGICLELIAFLGGAIAIYRGRGMSLSYFVDLLPVRFRSMIVAAGSWASIFLLVALAKPVPDFLKQAQRNKTPTLASRPRPAPSGWWSASSCCCCI